MGTLCLICSATFNSKPCGASVESEFAGGEGSNEGLTDPLTRFLEFSQHYLAIPQRIIAPILDKTKKKVDNGKQNKGASPQSVFCGDCQNVISSACKLYRELCQVQLRLAWKLGQLGELFGNEKLSSNLLIKLESQLGNNCDFGGKLVDELRTALMAQCERHFKNGQRLDAFLNRSQFNVAGGSSDADASSCPSDSASVGVLCDIEVDVDIKENDGSSSTADLHVADGESPYFAEDLIGNIGKGHFLCDQTSNSSGAASKNTAKVHCHVCQRGFAHKYSLEKHLRTVHGMTMTFNCPDCRLEFSSRQAAQQHNIDFHGGKGGGGGNGTQKKKNKNKSQSISPPYVPFGRPIKSPKRRKSLQQRQIPPNWKECSECYEVFPPNQYYYHMKRTHGHGTRHICPEPDCGKEFLFPTGLKRHMLHHGEKRFDCHVCHKKFSQIPTLKKHLESQHGQTVEIALQQDQQNTQKSSNLSKTQAEAAHLQNHLQSSSTSRASVSQIPVASQSQQQQQAHASSSSYHLTSQQQQNSHGTASWVFIPGMSSWTTYQQGMPPPPAQHHSSTHQ